MTGNKHAKGKTPADSDLANDPGIGSSRGTINEGDRLDQGNNTFEGDVENDTTPQGGINPRQKMRTNK
ncbi:hypothetical protein NKJ95_17510 [Mesorhizobium sp. M0012]|uniref:hypothetical protein n=1 Tax=Mesorhizobium sp. M0012 TaxID=2956840 RepID=UPI003334BF28